MGFCDESTYQFSMQLLDVAVYKQCVIMIV